jgi:hypothetical protein
MKRTASLLVMLALVITTILGAITAGAAPGDQTDPVVSLSYLNQVYQPTLVSDLHSTAERELTAVYNTRFLSLAETVSAYNAERQQANTKAQNAVGTILLKQGDVLTLLPGTKVMPVSGSFTADSEHLVNVSAGTRVQQNASLYAKTLYMKDDSQTGGLKVTSETATLWISGPYQLAASGSIDFASRADALKEMGLFQGSASGYNLENTATRVQGLVMFIRMLGLEDEALAYTGTHPFTDVPVGNWAYRYVAYAYQNGFTTGTSATKFSPDRTLTAQNYITFLMRALNYDEGTEFSYSTVLTDCVQQGLFTQKEISTLSSGSFTRARMVYLSYYSLFCTDQDNGKLLLTNLIADGAVSQSAADRAICRVIGTRLS